MNPQFPKPEGIANLEKRSRWIGNRTPKPGRTFHDHGDTARFWSAVSPLPLSYRSMLAKKLTERWKSVCTNEAREVSRVRAAC